jgi:hypothetical protein
MFLLSPWFLAGLGAIALPIIAHLFFRPRAKIVDFPMVRFLMSSQADETSRRRLRDLLLLLLRILIVTAAVLMFAQPLLSGAPDVTRHHIVLWDDTASMGYEDESGTLMDAARRRILDIAGAMHGNDRMSFVSLTGTRDNLLGLNRNDAAAAARRLAPVQAPPRAAQALHHVLELTGLTERDGQPVLHVVSDFQRTAWEGLLDEAVLTNATLHAVDILRVGPDDKPNVAIRDVTLARTEGRVTTVDCELVNYADTPREGTISIMIDNVPAAGSRFEIAPRAYTVAALDMRWPAGVDTPLPVTVAIDPADGLRVDDTRYAVFPPPSQRGARALVIESAPGEGFLPAQALASLADRHANGTIRVSTVAAGELPMLDPARYDLALFCSAALPAGPGRTFAEALLRHGGGILIFAGTNAPPQSAADAPAFLPARITGPLDTRTRRLAGIDRTEAFVSDLAGYDPAQVASYTSYPVEPLPGAAVPAVLEGDVPFLAVREQERGTVIFVNASADGTLSNFAKSPLLLPVLGALVERAGGRTQDSIPVGEPIRLRAENGRTLGLLSPSGQRRETVGDATGRARFVTDESGFHRLIDGERAYYAVNLAPEESNLDSLPAAEADALVRRCLGLPAGPATDTSDAVEPDRTPVWRLIGFALAALMIGELALANRMRR